MRFAYRLRGEHLQPTLNVPASRPIKHQDGIDVTEFFEAGGPPAIHAWTVYFDGSAMPNCGRIGPGAMITAPEGTGHTLLQALQEDGCNNEAEVRALLNPMLQASMRPGCTSSTALKPIEFWGSPIQKLF